MTDRSGLPSPLDRQALAAFVASLLASDDPGAEHEALSRLVVKVGHRLPSALDYLDSVVERISEMRRLIGPVLTLLPYGPAQETEHVAIRRQEQPAVASPLVATTEEQELVRAFQTLGHVKNLRHVAPGLAEAAKKEGHPVKKVPRAGSRGNGLLLVLDRYGRRAGLSLDMLIVALEAMDAVPPTQEAKRVAQWEASELTRRGWPVERTADGSYRYAGPKTEGSAM